MFEVLRGQRKVGCLFNMKHMKKKAHETHEELLIGYFRLKPPKNFQMSHWNYRIMKRYSEQGEYEYGIHEVFYDDEGKEVNYTESSLTPVCGSVEALKAEMLIMMRAFDEEVLEGEGK